MFGLREQHGAGIRNGLHGDAADVRLGQVAGLGQLTVREVLEADVHDDFAQGRLLRLLYGIGSTGSTGVAGLDGSSAAWRSRRLGKRVSRGVQKQASDLF